MKRSVFVFAAGAAIAAGSVLAAQIPSLRTGPSGRRTASRWGSSSPASEWTAETSAVFKAPTPTARSSPRHRP